MYKIVTKKMLNSTVCEMDIEAPLVARKAEAGQFIILRVDEKGERIPLTICDYDREADTVTIVLQTIGASTKMMAEYEVGDSFRDFVGPLGCKSDLIDESIDELKAKKILFVAGGVGTARQAS